MLWLLLMWVELMAQALQECVPITEAVWRECAVPLPLLDVWASSRRN